MKLLFTILFLITVLGSLNWALESIDRNIISHVFSVKIKGGWVLSKTGHVIYFMISFAAILCAILFFREGMYKTNTNDPLNEEDKNDVEEEVDVEEDVEEETPTEAPTDPPTKMKSKKSKKSKNKKDS